MVKDNSNLSIYFNIFQFDKVILRIGRSIHFPQVANLRSRHYNRTLGMAESSRNIDGRRSDYRF